MEDEVLLKRQNPQPASRIKHNVFRAVQQLDLDVLSRHSKSQHDRQSADFTSINRRLLVFLEEESQAEEPPTRYVVVLRLTSFGMASAYCRCALQRLE